MYTCVTGGNPAAVCPLKNEIPDDTKQKIAAEMNLSETAYVIPEEGNQKDFISCKRFGLRWFTPTVEVALCGHATLATAFILFYEIQNVNEELEFRTERAGILTAKRGEKKGSIQMRLPLDPAKIKVTNELEPKLWDLARSCLHNDIKIKEVKFSPTANLCLLICLDENQLGNRKDFEGVSMKMSMDELLQFDTDDRVKAIILTVKSTDGSGYDYYSRFIAPWFGIPEDPVTGSSFSVTGPYWADKLGKKNMIARQCSKRGGHVEMKLQDDGIVLTGFGTVTLKGTFHV